LPKYHIHEFYGFTTTTEVEAGDYDMAWEAFFNGDGKLIYDGGPDPQLESQECEEQNA
jgi:hypothetical protein